MSNFNLISKTYLPTLDINLEHYIHKITWAQHYHFDSKNTENVFMVALRTMPHDSTGVAHILEHTALCWSKNFNVRDPFFSMLRRSMQTFMNAFTSSDWTAYPFATENKKDFNNLLKIYLDAVFFPNLNYLDFLQEWYRFNFDKDENLMLEGVVFNEMKWVYWSVYSRLYEINKSILHPETTYHYDSGGYPQVIPNLTYENFIAFHKKHYHPTNATFFTFWDIKATEHQQNFEDLVLKFFPSKWEKVTTSNETRYLSPVKTTISYPSSDSDDKIHVLFSWLLDSANNSIHNLEARVLYSYLLGHSGSPLRFALENSDIIDSVSPLTMLDDSGREFRMTIGVVISDKNLVDDVENLIFQTLDNILKNWIDKNEIFWIIDKIEMSIRELSTPYPYWLSLMLQAIGAVTHDEDVVSMLDPTAQIDLIRKLVDENNFLVNTLKKYLLENQHFVRLTAYPDANAVKEEQKLEKLFLEKTQNNLSAEQKLKIKNDIKKLEERQQEKDDISILPKLELSDIPKKSKQLPEPQKISENYFHYNVSTNWISYLRNFFPISNLNKDEIFDLFLTEELIGELGYNNFDYSDVQKNISQTMAFSTSIKFFKQYLDNTLKWFFVPKIKFLPNKKSQAIDLYKNILLNHRFDEFSQIRNIFTEKKLLIKTGLIENWHRTAMLRAGYGNNISSFISEQINWISSIDNLAKFEQKSDVEIKNILEKNYNKLLENSPTTVTAGDKIDIDFQLNNSQKTDFLNWDFTAFTVNEAWITDISVGYCAMSIPAVPPNSEYAPLFVLLWQLLRDWYLHSAIREKGWAYWSGALYDWSSESFKFFSYRDPRIEWTFEDFEKSINWFLNTDHDKNLLDQAKMWVIAKMDTPSSPVREAFASYMSNIQWITDEIRNKHRKIILEATFEDLKNIVKNYLSDLSKASKVVITGKQNIEIVKKMWFNIFEL